MDAIQSVSADTKPGSPQYWGPLLWRMYHLMAEIPIDSTQLKLWKHILHSTALVMPCEKCREHLSHHLHTNPITEDIRKYLWNLHNQVNIRNESPTFSYEQLSIYAIQEKQATLLEIQELFKILQDTWKPLTHITHYPVAYNDWKKYIMMLLRIL